MIELGNVTLICLDCYNYGKAATAIKKSLQEIKPAKVKFLTDVDLQIDGVEVVKIPTIKSKREYSHFLIKELYKYFDTEYVLVIQHDGYVLNGDSWLPEFLEYDYIGAPWLYVDDRNVGNGGFSLRSHRLQKILGTNSFIKIADPEDEVIGRLYREYLEKAAIKFPSDDLADKFSFELRTPTQKTFGFHGRFHQPFQETVVIRREGAMGDVVMAEPVLHYFFKKGYRVVLDTLPQFKMLFASHYFKVHFPEELDPRLLNSVQTYNLDMSYESTPKQLHLKSYYDFCGIKDGEIRNPKLSIGFDAKEKQYKPFPKYAILHIDKRSQPGRNIEGVNWDSIVEYLNEKGYHVLLLGKGEHEVPKGATQMNTVNETLLAYICAGADLFCGIDSGIAHICSAFDVPSVIMFGSVDPEIIYPSLENKIVLHNHKKNVCSSPFCWHSVIGCEGVECIVDAKKPPCNVFDTFEIIESIDKLINEKSL